MSNIGFPCSESWRKRMYKKMVKPLAHGVSRHHLLKDQPLYEQSDDVSRSWENATQQALYEKGGEKVI
jgi:hypothetical protein